MAVQVEARSRPASPPPAKQAREPIVDARNLEKTYDTGKVEVNALQCVTLGIGRGEMVAISRSASTTGSTAQQATAVSSGRRNESTTS